MIKFKFKFLIQKINKILFVDFSSFSRKIVQLRRINWEVENEQRYSLQWMVQNRLIAGIRYIHRSTYANMTREKSMGYLPFYRPLDKNKSRSRRYDDQAVLRMVVLSRTLRSPRASLRKTIRRSSTYVFPKFITRNY